MGGINLEADSLTRLIFILQTVGAEAIIDAVVTNTPVFVRTSAHSNGKLNGSLVLNNIRLVDVPVAVGVLDGPTILPGGTLTIDSWVQGNVYAGGEQEGRFVQGRVRRVEKSEGLLDASGRVFGRGHPQYEGYAVERFVSVKARGAKADGRTDDTEVVQAILNEVCFSILVDPS